MKLLGRLSNNAEQNKRTLDIEMNTRIKIESHADIKIKIRKNLCSARKMTFITNFSFHFVIVWLRFVYCLLLIVVRAKCNFYYSFIHSCSFARTAAALFWFLFFSLSLHFKSISCWLSSVFNDCNLCVCMFVRGTCPVHSPLSIFVVCIYYVKNINLC